jgi:FtsH-binding integral membrane protein
MEYNQNVSPLEVGQVGGLERTNKVLRNTYMLTALALVPMAIGALVGTQMSFAFLAGSPMLAFFGFMIVVYGLMFGIQANRNSGVGVALMLVFTGVLGIMMGPLLQRVLSFSNGGALVAYAALGTAAVFAGMAAISSTIKRPLNGLGKFLMIGGIVLLVAMIANVFLQMPLFGLVISSMFILFSSLMILWQLNAIVTGGEDNYISATLTLVVSIYNIFVSLLQILGIFGGSRD